MYKKGCILNTPLFLCKKNIIILYMPSYNTINFENNKIIIIIDNDNEIWFNAKQICVSLKYADPKKAIIKKC
jgi:hypothetical protein